MVVRADARQSYADLGKRVHLSAPAVYERIRRLQASGIIVRYTVTINPEAVGLSLCVFVRLTTAGDATCEEIIHALAEHPEIEERHSITGDDNLLLKIRTADTKGLEELLQKIRRIAAVAKTLTTISGARVVVGAWDADELAAMSTEFNQEGHGVTTCAASKGGSN